MANRDEKRERKMKRQAVLAALKQQHVTTAVSAAEAAALTLQIRAETKPSHPMPMMEIMTFADVKSILPELPRLTEHMYAEVTECAVEYEPEWFWFCKICEGRPSSDGHPLVFVSSDGVGEWTATAPTDTTNEVSKKTDETPNTATTGLASST